MSSEDDDEEEELLQKTLAQQAPRDQKNYKRPDRLGSGPPRRAPPRTPPNRAPPPVPTAMDDDDEESDVELLSISSDEDAPPPARRDSGPRDAAKARQTEGDSDLEWDEDDQEPENWTDVDQTELVRRVREMRQDRTARATAPAARLRRATTMDTTPRGEDLMDPLGLGLINVKTLTLVRDKREGFRSEKGGSSEKDLKIDELQPSQDGTLIVRDSALREKVMYHSEKFDPKLFLAHIHQYTSSSDLEAGESALKTDLQNCKNQLKKLVKENFDCFISCKNTIDDIHSKLQQIEADPEGAGTIHLSNAIQNVDIVAKRAFGPLLERQAQAERIRSVQGMLQRFRTLFNLPSIIRSNISKGEYDLAIREYKKAKSLVQYTHVDILSRVLEEVDKIVLEFKEMLYKTMENPQVDTSQLENTIRLLLELEPDSDPVWYYLSIQDRRIRGLLEGCSLEHDARMDALHGRVQEKALADARWKQLQRESNKASDVDFNMLLGDQDKDGGDHELKESTGEESDALLGRLIRRLTLIFVQHVPNFWRLALLIFSGKFVKVSQPGSANGRSPTPSMDEAAMYPYEPQPTSSYCRHSMEEVVTMVHCILALYETKVQNAFNGLADANVLRPYMREALTEITKASVSLQGKDCAPVSAVQALLVLRIEVTRVFVVRLCTLIRGATTEFVYEEDWVPVPTTERGGTPYAISYLPLRFRDMLVAAMEHMTEMIQKLNSESAELLENHLVTIRQMQDHVRSTFMECFLDLSECLDKLAGELLESQTMEDFTGGEPGELRTPEREFLGLLPGSEVTFLHRRLLIVLSNTAFCKVSLLPQLLQKYESLWTYTSVQKTAKSRAPEENPKSTTEEALESFDQLEKNILTRYNLLKTSEINVAASNYLLNDGTQWGQSPTIKGIRDNVVELLHPLITVHAEVFAGAKPFVDKVICTLVEALIVSLSKVFSENKQKVLRLLDVNGYCQLTLELDFVDAVLGRFFTPTAREVAVGLRDILLEKVCLSVSEIYQAEMKGHATRSRGHEDAIGLDQGGPLSPDEIQANAQQISAEFLPAELKRARTNIACFMDFVPGNSQPGGRRMPNLPKPSPGRILSNMSGTSQYSRKSGIMGGESDIGRSGSGYPQMPQRLEHASSDIGSETISKGGPTSERYGRIQFDSRNQSESMRSSHRTVSSRSYDSDLL